MQIIRLPPDNMGKIMQFRNISALKDVDHELRIDDLSEVWNITSSRRFFYV